MGESRKGHAAEDSIAAPNEGDIAPDQSGGKPFPAAIISVGFFVVALAARFLCSFFQGDAASEAVRNAAESFQLIALYYAVVLALVAVFRRFRPLQPGAVAVLLCVPVISFLITYDYNLTESNILVPIYHFMDPSLYPRDLLVESSQEIGGYTFFGQLYSFLPMDIVGEAFYLSWMLCLASIALFFYYSFRNLIPSKAPFTAAIVCLVTLALTYRWQRYGGFILGDNDLIYNFMRHQTLGWAIGVWAIYSYLRGRYIAAGVLLGMVINVHINTGQHLMLALAACFLVDRQRSFKWFAATIGTAFIVGSYTLVPVVLTEVLRDRAGAVPGSYIFVSAYFRHPHHLIPSSWNGQYYLQYFVFLAMGIGCWIVKPDKTRVDRQFGAMVVMVLLGVLCGYVFVEVIPVDFAAKTQLSRFTILTKVILLLYIVQFVVRVCSSAGEMLGPIESRITKPAAAKLLMAVVIFSLLLPMSQRHKVRERPLDDFERFFVEETGTDSLVLIPTFSRFVKFGDRTKRSTVVNCKTMPFTFPYYQDYYERIMRSSGLDVKYDISYIQSLTPKEIKDGYHAQSAEDLLNLQKEYGFDYVVRLSEYGELPGLEKVYSDETQSVYRMPQSGKDL